MLECCCYSVGPCLQLIYFYFFNNHWSIGQCQVVLICGTLVFGPLALGTLALFQDPRKLPGPRRIQSQSVLAEIQEPSTTASSTTFLETTTEEAYSEEGSPSQRAGGFQQDLPTPTTTTMAPTANFVRRSLGLSHHHHLLNK
eukprot:GHVU01060489.1.p2 GENE.GHVU01060489.1~~GHVU01060489.1.p2  ORF type:complete len:142 (-),score=9.73 GHVU01060489.1:467-892(-)